MKFVRYQYRAINLAQVIDIAVSANYLVLTTTDGREEKLVHGGEKALEALMEEILAFLNDDRKVRDCEEFMLTAYNK